MRSWPPSPLDEGSWTSWSTRCDSEGRILPEPSDSRQDGIRQGIRIEPSNPGLNIREGYYQNEPPDGYYRQMQHERFPDQQRNFPHSNLQWQHTQSQDGEVSPTARIQDGPYYRDSRRYSSGQMSNDQHQYSQRDGFGHGSSRHTGS